MRTDTNGPALIVTHRDPLPLILAATFTWLGIGGILTLADHPYAPVRAFISALFLVTASIAILASRRTKLEINTDDDTVAVNTSSILSSSESTIKLSDVEEVGFVRFAQ